MPPTPRPRLRTGCRRGEKAALDALLYGAADEVYALALAAVSDEAQARECLSETWRRSLVALGGLRFAANPSERVWRIACRVVAERAGGSRAKAAVRTVPGKDDAVGLEGVSAPEDLLEELSALSDDHTPVLRTQWHRRRHLFRGGLVALFVAAIGVWSAVFYQRSLASSDLADMQYRCLRQRVIQHDLAATVRTAAGGLEDPGDADREAAANCERIILVFEEIANSDRLDSVYRLRYIRKRVARDQLAEFARSLPQDSAELQEAMPRVALALEEVQNL